MINLTDQMIYRLGNLNTEQQRISYQMSTGKELDRGSDDSSIFARELYVNDKIRTYEGLQSQIEKTTAQNNVSDSSIGEMKTLLDSIKQDMLKALNAGMDPADKQATAINMQGIKENLLTLANEKVNGEYLFTGTDTSIRPFEKDATTGIVSYNGDAIVRKIAVEPNTYRDRGVTGIDVLFYTADETSSATGADGISFTASETIIDNSGLEWVKPFATAGTKLTFDIGDAANIVDDGGTSWTVDTTAKTISDGTNTLSITNIEGDKWQTELVGGNKANAGTSADTVLNSLIVNGVTDLREMSTNGTLTGNTLAITSAVPPAGSGPFTTADLNTNAGYISGDSMMAKHSIFEDIDAVITALNADDNATIQTSLDLIDKSYDATNIAHSKLGGRNKIFELADTTVTSRLTHFNILSQEVSGADLAKVAMEAKALEMTYTALYSTITKMNSLSLVNFVK